jgi:selT/selW/selH-like putative selenoprotein
LAEDLQRKFGIRAELVRGSGGVFEVALDNQVIFSKQKLGRFPEPGEVEEALSAMVRA